MNENKSALLLIGSPKGLKSSSGSLGRYLVNGLEEKGFEGEVLHIHPMVNSEEGLKKISSAIDSSDIIIFASPLYIDSIPAPVITAMEFVFKNRKATTVSKKQHFVALVNSGFPEPVQNATALAIYQQFANEAGFIWAGGLAYASGQAAIDGRPLDNIGFMARNVRKSLDIAARALSEGKSIPEESHILSAKPIIPVWMFLLIGNNFWWRARVKDKKVWKAINNRPYQNTG
jgi:multimeric flavodoxin WrbA